MTKALMTIGLVLFAGLPSFSAAACKKPGLWKVQLHALRPTQFAVGLREIVVKEDEIREKDSEGKLDKFLCSKPVPVVLGPGGEPFVLDHHHLSYALIQYGEKNAYAETVEDRSTQERSSFWNEMVGSHYVYLKDEQGRDRTPADLPRSITDLKDDPYRSLAYFVRKAGGFNKVDVPYADFQWAEFFRSRIDTGTSDADFRRATAEGLKLARSPAAAHLPGYIPSP